jgi:DNA helicase II / ATP-dependent DNA helicase PcrA
LHKKNGGKLSDIAILYRTNAQSLAFEKEFPRKGIQYHIVGALRFYEREEVKDVLAYLSLLLNPRDEIAFRRIVNKPARGLGEGSVDTILDKALRRGSTTLEACRESREDMRGKGKAGLERFLEIMEGAARLLGANAESAPADASAPYSFADGGKPIDRGTASLGSLLEYFIAESKLADYHKDQDEIAGTQKLANMEELVNAASIYPLLTEGLAEFLETIELDRSFQSSDGSETQDAVTLITMHNTKGLEFPTVIVTGLEQGLFPRDDEEGEELEEQRRLLYVALTRAKDTLYLTACRWRRIHGRLFETTPSRFLTEISPELYQFWRNGADPLRSPPALGGHAPQHGAARYGAAQYGAARQGAQAARPASRDAEPAPSRAPATARQSAGSEWRAGQTVYHDEYGQGAIIKASMTENSGPLVIVQFESGKVAQFFPKYTRKLERIKE